MEEMEMEEDDESIYFDSCEFLADKLMLPATWLALLPGLAGTL